MANVSTLRGSTLLPDEPIKCPACGTLMIPTYLFGVSGKDGFEVLTQCRNDKCHESFISIFEYSGLGYHLKNYKTLPMKKEMFSDIIMSLSPSFESIYNQAYASEQMGLDSICGVGYRKALEFLVKDFAIKEEPAQEEQIKKMPLQQCLSQYIKNAQIKPIVERAIWLGNDETHYVKKWETKDVNDLKGLISLSVYWIEAEIKSRSVLAEMQGAK